MKRNCWVILTVLMLTACATTKSPSPAEIELIRDQQEIMFSSLKSGQSLTEVMDVVLQYQQFSFEVLENDTVYQYVQAQYPVTEVLFAVFFEDEKLVSLILDQDVTDAARCQTNSGTGSSYWLFSGIRTFADWIKERNQLGRDYDPRTIHLWERDPVDVGDVVEAVSYLPMIAIFLPLYGFSEIAGGMQNRSKLKKEQRYYLETVGKIRLGTSEDDLLQLLGSADRMVQLEGTQIWTYNLPAISFGIVDGAVKWKKSSSVGLPRNSSTIYGTPDCSLVHEDS